MLLKNNEKYENKWWKFQGSKAQKNYLRQKFEKSRSIFDKLLKSTERNYFRQYCNELEKFETKNPIEFWGKINRLGPKKSKITDRTDSISQDDVSITNDTNIVFDKWERGFKGLYNKEDIPDQDIEYKAILVEKKKNF